MKAPTPLLQKLWDMNQQMRTNSICWSCGKPREGIRTARCGGQVTDSFDETGSMSESISFGLPQSAAQAGLCICERIRFRADDIDRNDDRELTEHPAYDGIIRGYDVSDGRVIGLRLTVAPGRDLTVTAQDFNGPVECRIVAPDKPENGMKFALIRERQVA